MSEGSRERKRGHKGEKKGGAGYSCTGGGMSGRALRSENKRSKGKKKKNIPAG